MKSNFRLSKTILLLVSAIVLCIPVFIFATEEAGEQAELAFKAEPSIKEIEPLPIVGTEENLKKILEEAFEENEYSLNIKERMKDGVAFDKAVNATTSAIAAEASSAKTMESAGAGDYSTTNVQVESRRSDIVKTDGKFISGKWQQDSNCRSLSRRQTVQKEIIDLEREEMRPLNCIWTINTYLIGPETAYRYSGNMTTHWQLKGDQATETGTKLMVYNIEDKNKIEKLREIELEGRYLHPGK